MQNQETQLVAGVCSPRNGLWKFPLIVAIAILTTLLPSSSAQAPTPLHVEPAAPPLIEHPITLDQLRILLQELNNVEPVRQLTMEEAERQRKTLPAWFPPSVWDAVEQKIMAIDIPKAQLPLYQRYFSQENADRLILFYQGPLGKELAEHFIQREVAAVHSGTSGAATTARAMNETAHSSDADLFAKRMSEFSPEDKEKVSIAIQSTGKAWQPISNEISSSYNDLVNDTIQKEVAAHASELRAAQQTYLRQHSTQH